MSAGISKWRPAPLTPGGLRRGASQRSEAMRRIPRGSVVRPSAHSPQPSANRPLAGQVARPRLLRDSSADYLAFRDLFLRPCGPDGRCVCRPRGSACSCASSYWLQGKGTLSHNRWATEGKRMPALLVALRFVTDDWRHRGL